MTDTIDTLTAEYEAWLAANPNVPKLSADEALEELITIRDDLEAKAREADAIAAQMGWLGNFCDRWEAVVELERAHYTRQQEWAQTRVWCADLEDAGLSHALDYHCADNYGDNMPGYAYSMGCWIKDNRDGTYWTIANRGDATGTLAECEQFLWDNHAKYETN